MGAYERFKLTGMCVWMVDVQFKDRVRRCMTLRCPPNSRVLIQVCVLHLIVDLWSIVSPEALKSIAQIAAATFWESGHQSSVTHSECGIPAPHCFP